MRTQEKVRAIAGSLIVLSSLLAWTWSNYWLILTLFVGLNLLQYSVTGWCLLKNLLDEKPLLSRG